MDYATTRFKRKKGTREEVWKGAAQETAGGLQKKDLMISKTGTLVSKKASQSAKNRMKSGKGLCGYCIEEYKKTKSMGNKKSTKKGPAKLSKKSTKKSTKESTKKVELKVKKVKGASQKKVDELKKEIEKLLEKAGRIVNRSGKETAETRKLLEQVHKKRLEKLRMVKSLRVKKK